MYILSKQNLRILYLPQFAGMLESVYSTPEPERVDNLESTSSAIQGAFSTLYNEDFPQASHSCHSCGNIIHQLVQDIKELRKDVDTLKKKVKASFCYQ